MTGGTVCARSFKGRFVWDVANQVLRWEYREFGFGHIKPGAVLRGVAPLETLDKPSGFGGRTRVIGQVLEDLGVIDRNPPIGDLDAALGFSN